MVSVRNTSKRDEIYNTESESETEYEEPQPPSRLDWVISAASSLFTIVVGQMATNTLNIIPSNMPCKQLIPFVVGYSFVGTALVYNGAFRTIPAITDVLSERHLHPANSFRYIAEGGIMFVSGAVILIKAYYL